MYSISLFRVDDVPDVLYISVQGDQWLLMYSISLLRVNDVPYVLYISV
jgi:hypothetical protein